METSNPPSLEVLNAQCDALIEYCELMIKYEELRQF